MSLIVIRRTDTGTLWITGTVKPAGAAVGRRIRQRAGSDDPATAKEEAAAIEARILRDFHHGAKQSTHSFAEACQSYLTHQERSEGTLAEVRRLLQHWKSTPLGAIDQEAVDNARRKILRPGSSDATWRKTVSILSAIMTHAAKRRWCERPEFDLPPIKQGRTRFLMPAEYLRLEAAAKPHLKPLLRYLVCTGARLGETLMLEWSQVDLAGARISVWADQAKGRRQRIIDLSPAAVRALSGLKHRDGIVFRSHLGQPYRSTQEDGSGGQIKKAFKSACRKAEVTDATPHTLRHTFATWFYAVTPDLIRLQHAGGWASIDLVTRYAHLMPSGQVAAIEAVWGVAEPAGKIVAVSNG